ncbi:UNVERIFIED_CONTAM: hypothetical protein Sindi_2016800 [Sesamum indicum]
MLGEGLPRPLDLGRKCSCSVKIAKREEQSKRTKLCIGGHEHADGDREMRECKLEVYRVDEDEKDVNKALKKGNNLSFVGGILN